MNCNVQRLIWQRSLARAALLGGTCKRGDAPRSVVPFTEWLLYVHGVADWQTVKPYNRGLLYGDYRVDCVRAGMMYESPSVYGVEFMW